MPFNPVTITISGEHDSGKTTLARLIEDFLRATGYKLVSFNDVAPLPHDQKPDYPARSERNRNLRAVNIEVKLEE